LLPVRAIPKGDRFFRGDRFLYVIVFLGDRFFLGDRYLRVIVSLW